MSGVMVGSREWEEGSKRKESEQGSINKANAVRRSQFCHVRDRTINGGVPPAGLTIWQPDSLHCMPQWGRNAGTASSKAGPLMCATAPMIWCLP